MRWRDGRALNHVESFCMGQLRVGDEADEGLLEIAQAADSKMKGAGTLESRRRHVLTPPPSRHCPYSFPSRSEPPL